MMSSARQVGQGRIKTAPSGEASDWHTQGPAPPSCPRPRHQDRRSPPAGSTPPHRWRRGPRGQGARRVDQQPAPVPQRGEPAPGHHARQVTGQPEPVSQQPRQDHPDVGDRPRPADLDAQLVRPRQPGIGHRHRAPSTLHHEGAPFRGPDTSLDNSYHPWSGAPFYARTHPQNHDQTNWREYQGRPRIADTPNPGVAWRPRKAPGSRPQTSDSRDMPSDCASAPPAAPLAVALSPPLCPPTSPDST